VSVKEAGLGTNQNINYTTSADATVTFVRQPRRRQPQRLKQDHRQWPGDRVRDQQHSMTATVGSGYDPRRWW
jgi:hypothetical protein